LAYAELKVNFVEGCASSNVPFHGLTPVSTLRGFMFQVQMADASSKIQRFNDSIVQRSKIQ
jgi:hypothetical protein